MLDEMKFINEFKEENHLCNVYNDKNFRGWYKISLEDKEMIDVVVWFRLPPTITLYKDVLRNFSNEERLAGIHRMLIGKDLQEETKKMLEQENINEYMDTLSEEQIHELLNRMENIITLDCNKIPYLHIRNKKEDYNEEETTKIIKDFLNNQKDYLNIFYKVLNEKISIDEATILSEGVIFSEVVELKNEKSI